MFTAESSIIGAGVKKWLAAEAVRTEFRASLILKRMFGSTGLLLDRNSAVLEAQGT